MVIYLPNEDPIHTKSGALCVSALPEGVANMQVIFLVSIGKVSTSIGEGLRHLNTVI